MMAIAACEALLIICQRQIAITLWAVSEKQILFLKVGEAVQSALMTNKYNDYIGTYHRQEEQMCPDSKVKKKKMDRARSARLRNKNENITYMTNMKNRLLNHAQRTSIIPFPIPPL